MHPQGGEFGDGPALSRRCGGVPIDLCSLFSNLLDNAIRACTQLPPEQTRRIRLTVGMQGDDMLVRCDNPATKGLGPRPEYSFEAVAASITQQLQEGSARICLKFSDDGQLLEAQYDLFTQQRIYELLSVDSVTYYTDAGTNQYLYIDD